jgi:hypothetical protein
VFLIDEHARFVFYDFVKRKSEVVASVQRGVAAFHATVGTPIGEDGRASKALLSRPVWTFSRSILLRCATRLLVRCSPMRHASQPLQSA